MDARYRVTPGVVVTLAPHLGQEGPWVVLGQATYTDDDGREVEHDWLLVSQGDDELAVHPLDVKPLVSLRKPARRRHVA